MRSAAFLLYFTVLQVSARYSSFYSSKLLESCGKHEFLYQYHTRSARAIYNGRFAAKGEFPAQVAIVQAENGTLEPWCGGTLISPSHVITAAHCFGSLRKGKLHSDQYISLGSLCSVSCKQDDAPIIRKIKKVIVPTKFVESKTMPGIEDIAIVVLVKPISVQHACISWNSTMKDSLDVVGWGFTSGNGAGVEQEKSPQLRTASIRVVKTTEDGLIYAYPGPSDACQADSGGGLYQTTIDGRRELVGVVHAGQAGCAGTSGVRGFLTDKSLPTYYSVARYADWICYWTGVCGPKLASEISFQSIPRTTVFDVPYELPFPTRNSTHI